MHPFIDAWAARRPDAPLVVGLAGTDLYQDLPADRSTRRSLDQATAIVVLQSLAIDRLAAMDEAWAAKATVVHQSVDHPRPPREPSTTAFVVAVLAHLRAVKDPLMTARAARLLPVDSRVRGRAGRRGP